MKRINRKLIIVLIFISIYSICFGAEEYEGLQSFLNNLYDILIKGPLDIVETFVDFEKLKEKLPAIKSALDAAKTSGILLVGLFTFIHMFSRATDIENFNPETLFKPACISALVIVAINNVDVLFELINSISDNILDKIKGEGTFETAAIKLDSKEDITVIVIIVFCSVISIFITSLLILKIVSTLFVRGIKIIGYQIITPLYLSSFSSPGGASMGVNFIKTLFMTYLEVIFIRILINICINMPSIMKDLIPIESGTGIHNVLLILISTFVSIGIVKSSDDILKKL